MKTQFQSPNLKGLAKFSMSKELLAAMMLLPDGATIEIVGTPNIDKITVIVASPDLPLIGPTDSIRVIQPQYTKDADGNVSFLSWGLDTEDDDAIR